MREKITKKVEEALQGNRKIEITFKQNADKRGVRRLIAMSEAAMLWLKANYITELMFFQSRQKWKDEKSRVMTLTLTKMFDKDQFVRELCDDIEDIQIAA